MHQMKKLLHRVATLGIVSAICITSAAATTGTVNTSVLRLRADASTSSSILTKVSAGTAVSILDTAANGWYKVSYKNIQGYMSSSYLTVAVAAPAADTTVAATTSYAQVTTSGSALNLRSGPSTDYSRVATIPDGTVLTLSSSTDGWYYITYNGVSGYVAGGYLTLIDEATATAAIAAAQQAATVSSAGQQIAAYAQNYLGCPYVYGAAGSSSFDCSGFTMYVYKHFGYSLPHGASSQLSYGTTVSMSELQPGDLVFFHYDTSYPASHVGIYIGNGRFIHASTTGYGVRTDTLTSGHYCSCFIGGRHIAS